MKINPANTHEVTLWREAFVSTLGRQDRRAMSASETQVALKVAAETADFAVELLRARIEVPS